MSVSFLNWKKHKQGIQLCYGVYKMPSSTLKFQFVFGFSGCLWVIFSLLNFENFWFYIVVVVVWVLIIRHNCSMPPLTPCRWIKNLSAKTTKYITKCWERSVKSKSNLNLIRVMKNSSFDQHFSKHEWSKLF